MMELPSSEHSYTQLVPCTPIVAFRYQHLVGQVPDTVISPCSSIPPTRFKFTVPVISPVTPFRPKLPSVDSDSYSPLVTVRGDVIRGPRQSTPASCLKLEWFVEAASPRCHESSGSSSFKPGDILDIIDSQERGVDLLPVVPDIKQKRQRRNIIPMFVDPTYNENFKDLLETGNGDNDFFDL